MHLQSLLESTVVVREFVSGVGGNIPSTFRHFVFILGLFGWQYAYSITAGNMLSIKSLSPEKFLSTQGLRE